VGFKSLRIRVLLGACWLLAVGAGFFVILNYQNTVGTTGLAPQHWPAGTRLQPAPDRPTLLMFAHPQCPCTRASLEELNRLLARTQGRVTAQVLCFRPAQFPETWAHSDLWRSAEAIPGVAVHADLDGVEAQRFGAETSGYVLLYDTHGQLLFKGGITASRGHAGDNAGEDAILALLTGQPATVCQTRVFGCSLLNKCVPPVEGVVR
jgi:hypothetical protein